jgi:hypothetical protein
MVNFNDLNLNGFNSFLKKAKQAVMCDSECQKQRKSEELKKIYLDSQTNLASADHQLVVAEKNYVSFTQGELEYNNKKEEELHKKAKIIINEYKKNFERESKGIQVQIDTYNSLIANYKNVVELYLKYKNDNLELTKELKNSSSDILTNERKTYYENQGIDSLSFVYYYVLFIIYIIFVIGYLITSIFYQSQINWKYRVLYFIILFILPFISTWILEYIIFIIYYIYNLFPKNIHLYV